MDINSEFCTIHQQKHGHAFLEKTLCFFGSTFFGAHSAGQIFRCLIWVYQRHREKKRRAVSSSSFITPLSLPSAKPRHRRTPGGYQHERAVGDDCKRKQEIKQRQAASAPTSLSKKEHEGSKFLEHLPRRYNVTKTNHNHFLTKKTSMRKLFATTLQRRSSYSHEGPASSTYVSNSNFGCLRIVGRRYIAPRKYFGSGKLLQGVSHHLYATKICFPVVAIRTLISTPVHGDTKEKYNKDEINNEIGSRDTTISSKSNENVDVTSIPPSNTTAPASTTIHDPTTSQKNKHSTTFHDHDPINIKQILSPSKTIEYHVKTNTKNNTQQLVQNVPPSSLFSRMVSSYFDVVSYFLPKGYPASTGLGNTQHLTPHYDVYNTFRCIQYSVMLY